jgi:hypothetical protein
MMTPASSSQSRFSRAIRVVQLRSSHAPKQKADGRKSISRILLACTAYAVGRSAQGRRIGRCCSQTPLEGSAERSTDCESVLECEISALCCSIIQIRNTIFNTGLEYGIKGFHGDSAQDHRGSTSRSSREGAASQRDRRHPDRPSRAATSCGIADVRSPTPLPRQGSLHADVGRVEG